MKVKKLTLSFSGEFQALETPYRENYLNKYLNHFRLCMVFGLLAFSSGGLLDPLMFPEQTSTLWLIRYSVGFPVFLGCLLISYTKYYKKIWPVLSILMVVMTGLASTALITITPVPLNQHYFASIIISLLFNFVIIRLPFVWATLSGVVLLAGYEFVSLFVVQTAPVILFTNTYYLTAIVMIGMFGTYILELADRRDYVLSNQLLTEKEKTARINAELETRVAERTQELKKTNTELALEIDETKKAKAEQAVLEQQLRQAHKMEAIGTLAGGIAHDFNTMIGTIKGYTDIISNDVPEGNAIQEDLASISKVADQASALVGQIRDFSRPKGTDRIPLDMVHLVKDTVTLVKSLLPSTITVHEDYQADSLSVRADEDQIKQILINLCTNAKDFMSGSQQQLQIRVQIAEPEEVISFAQVSGPEHFMKLTLSDNGTGIDQKILERIFDPYFTTKDIGQGSGLGLSIVHSIVKNHGGFIFVKSELKKGTTFTIYLPLTKDSESLTT